MSLLHDIALVIGWAVICVGGLGAALVVLPKGLLVG
jgi:hypothetical protein